MSESQRRPQPTISFTTLVETLFFFCSPSKHPDLQALKYEVLSNGRASDNSKVQRRLVEIAGKDAVQSAIIRILGKDKALTKPFNQHQQQNEPQASTSAPSSLNSGASANPYSGMSGVQPSPAGHGNSLPSRSHWRPEGHTSSERDPVPVAPPAGQTQALSGQHSRSSGALLNAFSPTFAKFSPSCSLGWSASDPTKREGIGQLGADPESWPSRGGGAHLNGPPPAASGPGIGRLPSAPPSSGIGRTLSSGALPLGVDHTRPAGAPSGSVSSLGSGGLAGQQESAQGSELHMALTHAARCRSDGCNLAYCKPMKAKLYKLDGHVQGCTKSSCLLCRMWQFLQKAKDESPKEESHAEPAISSIESCSGMPPATSQGWGYNKTLLPAGLLQPHVDLGVHSSFQDPSMAHDSAIGRSTTRDSGIGRSTTRDSCISSISRRSTSDSSLPQGLLFPDMISSLVGNHGRNTSFNSSLPPDGQSLKRNYSCSSDLGALPPSHSSGGVARTSFLPSTLPAARSWSRGDRTVSDELPACGDRTSQPGRPPSQVHERQPLDSGMDRQNRRKALIAHVFSCLQPTCGFPRCAAMRHKLHNLAPHSVNCTLAKCDQCKIWKVYNSHLRKSVSKQHELAFAKMSRACSGDLGGQSEHTSAEDRWINWNSSVGGSMMPFTDCASSQAAAPSQAAANSLPSDLLDSPHRMLLDEWMDDGPDGMLSSRLGTDYDTTLASIQQRGAQLHVPSCGIPFEEQTGAGQHSPSGLSGASDFYPLLSKLDSSCAEDSGAALESLFGQQLDDALEGLAQPELQADDWDPPLKRRRNGAMEGDSQCSERPSESGAASLEDDLPAFGEHELGRSPVGMPEGSASEQLEWKRANGARSIASQLLDEAEKAPGTAIDSISPEGWKRFETEAGGRMTREVHEISKFEPGCLVDVLTTEGESGWRPAVVRSRSANMDLYLLQLEGGEDDGQLKEAPFHSLRLRCCFAGCRKHALLMQRPPRDCDLCARPLQHPMRSYWEFSGGMAEALSIGLSSALLCSTCHREKRQQPRASSSQRKQEAFDGPPSVLIGTVHVPFFAFREVPIVRQQLQADDQRESEHQNWVQCSSCLRWNHWVCVLYNQRAHKIDLNLNLVTAEAQARRAEDGTQPLPWRCSDCEEGLVKSEHVHTSTDTRDGPFGSEIASGTMGHPTSQHRDALHVKHSSSADLPETAFSRELQSAVKEELNSLGVSCEPVQIRMVSCTKSQSAAKEVMLQRQWRSGGAYPPSFPYLSRAIMAFQKVEGHDVAFFMMYTQEYDADCPAPNTRRVYISYVDTVKYFHSTPAGHRTTVYRTIICTYLQMCRARGFQHVHIWVEPPRTGDEYIFYARPLGERKPMKREKLRSWYCKILERAKADGVVQKYCGMHDEFKDITSARQIPMFNGDQWEITVPALLQEGTDGSEDVGRPPSEEGVPKSDAGSQPSTSATNLTPPHVPGSARQQKLKGVTMSKSVSEDLVAKVQKQMRRFSSHFLVATLANVDESLSSLADLLKDENHVQYAVVNSRQAMIFYCQAHGLQFNSLRYAQYSTMMLIYEMLNPSEASKALNAKYCLPTCLRNRIDDGSMMIACDACDNWLHPGCLGGAAVTTDDDSFVCPACLDSQADDYLTDSFWQS